MALDDKDIIKRIQSHLRRGINSEDGEVTDVRQSLFDGYMGSEYGNEREGYSRVVTREMLQAIEWALPALLRVFLGGVKAVEFRASGPDDVQQAKFETDVINHWFFDGNEEETGFMVLYTFLKDLLMFPNAYMSVEPTETIENDAQEIEGATADLITKYKAEGANVKVLGKEGSLYRLSVHTEKTEKRIVFSGLPADTVIVEHGHHKLGLDKTRFLCIRAKRTKSDLREEGYDEADLDLLDRSDMDGELWNDEETTRHFYIDEEPDGGDDEADDDADKPYWVHTCYMAIDVDEDGISERRKIVMAGKHILENEEDNYMPVVAGSAIPMPHKHIGMGFAEIVEDLQRIMTSLTRQLLDNIYKQNVQRRYIHEGWLLSDNSTMDQLLDGSSEFVLGRGRPADNVMPEVTPPIVAEIVQAIEAFKEAPQMRTGVAPQLSLDPSVLEKSTMGAFVGALEQASQRLELLARLVSETVLVPAFQKAHYLARTHLDEPQQVEIGGQWVTVDPRTWKRRSRMQVNVGLGFNNKQMMLMLLTQLLQIQKEAMAAGLADHKTIYATLERLTEQMNLGHARTYFVDPSTPGWKAPEPPMDPAMVQAKANEASLMREAERKDMELKHTIAKDKEAEELEAARELTKLLTVKATGELNVAKIAEIHAKITQMNRDKNAQAGPAEDSSQDEFAAASSMGEPGSHYGPAKGTPSPVDKLEGNGKAKPKGNGATAK